MNETGMNGAGEDGACMIQARKLAVFASGNGSNFQAIVDAVASGALPVNVELLICDKPKAKVVERAKAAGVEVYTFRPKNYSSREAYEAEIVELLKARGIDLIVLAGYMRLVTKVLVEPFAGRMINLHPSLLPAFPGLDAVGQALRYGVKLTGATVHMVDEGLDSGPVITQEAVQVYDDDTEETLLERIHKVEHELLIKTIRWYAEGRISLDGRKVSVN